ncbi:alpha/beta hydrolase family protein [Aldersonia sp. NBC_00410]|uniref:alpha/beta hydrolase family protein n=1 Tax=Aldersonia sp. NBC_00410 TaxID=2975954 RepID=UPI00224F4F4E|nr:alpha/beta hydrolase family protein [Aldersonia sp. NBC_00410]MCX5045327.1 alpha/beta hydrolase family protein [Aldersonia sp. NBC_00410]
MAERSNAAPCAEPVELMLSRFGLLAAVLPRSVASVVAANRRSADAAVPPGAVAMRPFGETVIDEFFVAASSFVRRVPDEPTLARAVDRCAAVADELAELGVAGCNPAPGPLERHTLVKRQFGGIRFERLNFRSAPRLPDVLARAGHAEPENATLRLVGKLDEPRHWVVWLHGAGQGRPDDLVSLRARHLHEELGLNVALPVLPLHGNRRRRGHPYPGFDPLENIATALRAVSDVRAVIRWVADQGARSITLVGLSLGGQTAALAAALEPEVSGIAVVVPMLDLHETLAHHLERAGGRGARLAALLRSESIRTANAAVDPATVAPSAPAARRLVVAATNDRVTSPIAAARLHDSWGGRVHWHPGGHVGTILSHETRSVLDEFIGEIGADTDSLRDEVRLGLGK